MRVTKRMQDIRDLMFMQKPDGHREYCINFPQIEGVPCDLDCNKLDIDVSLLNSALPKMAKEYPLPLIYVYEYWNPETKEHRGIYLNGLKLLYNLFAFMRNEVAVELFIPREEYVNPEWILKGTINEIHPQMKRKILQSTVTTYTIYETSDTDNLGHLHKKLHEVKI